MNTQGSPARPLKRLAEIDIFPEFSKRVRKVVSSPLGILLIAAAVATLVAFVVHPRVLALAGGLLLVALLGVCWPWITRRGLSVQVRFAQPRAVEGEAVPVTATLTNHLPWPAWEVQLNLTESHTVRLPRLPGRAKSICRWEFTPPLRGVYPASAPSVGTSFPFGLWESRGQVGLDEPLLVWPRTFPVGPVPNSEGADVPEGQVTRNKVGSTGDVLGVRPYRRGDSPRRIHWPKSARHDCLIVCELQSHSRPVVLLVVDADLTRHTSGPDGSYEWAIRVAASLAQGWLRSGAQVGLAWGETFIEPQSGSTQLTRLMDELTRMTSCPQPLQALLKMPRVRHDQSLKVVITTTSAELVDSTGEDRLVMLDLQGFGGISVTTHCHRWLTIPNPDEAPVALRYGTAEAQHGS